MIDLFNAHGFPEQCNNADFFGHCRDLLLPQGILAVNLANIAEQWPIFMQIRTHFQQCTICIPVKGTANMIVLGYKDTSIKPLLNMLDNHFNLKQLTWDPHWGCIACV